MSDPATDAAIVEELAGALMHETWCNRAAPVLDDDDIACAALRLSTARQVLPVVRRAQAEALREAAREDGISTHKLSPVEMLTLRVVKVGDLWTRADAFEAGRGEQ